MSNEYTNLSETQLAAIAELMDDEIRERLHSELSPCAPGEFLTAYLSADPDFPIHQFETE